MKIDQPISAVAESTTNQPSSGQSFGEWLQEPLGSIVTASVAIIGSFGVVLGGIWSIGLAIN